MTRNAERSHCAGVEGFAAVLSVLCATHTPANTARRVQAPNRRVAKCRRVIMTCPITVLRRGCIAWTWSYPLAGWAARGAKSHKISALIRQAWRDARGFSGRAPYEASTVLRRGSDCRRRL